MGIEKRPSNLNNVSVSQLVYLQLEFDPLRRNQRVSTFDVSQHFVVAHSLEGKATECDNLVK